MDGLVELFAEQVIGAGIIDAAQAGQIRRRCPESSDIIAFGEALLEEFPDKFEEVQGLLDETADAYTKGERVTLNPFDPGEPEPAPHPHGPALRQRDTGKRHQETVVSAAGVLPGLPDFGSLESSNREQVASALIGMLLALGDSDFSDLHLSGGSRPFGRRFGKLEYLAERPIDDALAGALAMALLSAEQKAYFETFQDYDFAIALDNGRRYRTNLMQHRDGLKITFRLVPQHVLTLEELGFAGHTQTIKNLLAYHNGLILVTGPVGCGKTTTLAAMVDELNTSSASRIRSRLSTARTSVR